MGTGDEADGVWFRRSTGRVVAGLSAVVVVMLAAMSVVGELVFDRPWYDLFPQLPILLLSTFGWYAQLSRQKGLPLRVTRDELVLTRRDGTSLAIDRDALFVAEIRGRMMPYLVLAVADPERTRPVLSRWEWGELGFWSMSRIRREHEVQIPLTGVVPGVNRLRAELAERPAGRDGSVTGPA